MAFKLARLFNGFIFLLFCFLANPSFAFAQDPDLGHDPATFSDLEGYIATLLGRFTSLALIAVFVMLVYGGFRYLTAGGNPENNQAASKIITYAILGLVLMLGVWFIIRFLEIFLNVNLTEFSLIIQ